MFEHMPPIYVLLLLLLLLILLLLLVSLVFLLSLSSRSLPNLSILLSLSHTRRRTDPHTHSSVMSPYNPCYICTRRERKWHIKNRFFISCQEEEWTHRQTWHPVWCQYPATYSSLWQPAPISYTEKHICHFLLTLEHKLCKRFGDRSITYCTSGAIWANESKTETFPSLIQPVLALFSIWWL